jgi:hypothetical protein
LASKVLPVPGGPKRTNLALELERIEIADPDVRVVFFEVARIPGLTERRVVEVDRAVETVLPVGQKVRNTRPDSEELLIDVLLHFASVALRGLVGIYKPDESVADAVLVRRAGDPFELVGKEQVEQDVAHHLFAAVLFDKPRLEAPRVGENLAPLVFAESLEAASKGDDVHHEERAAVVEVLAGIADAGIHRASQLAVLVEAVALPREDAAQELALARAIDRVDGEEQVDGDRFSGQSVRSLACIRELGLELLLEGPLGILLEVEVEMFVELLGVLRGPDLLAGEQKGTVVDETVLPPPIDDRVDGGPVMLAEAGHSARTLTRSDSERPPTPCRLVRRGSRIAPDFPR